MNRSFFGARRAGAQVPAASRNAAGEAPRRRASGTPAPPGPVYGAAPASLLLSLACAKTPFFALMLGQSLPPPCTIRRRDSFPGTVLLPARLSHKRAAPVLAKSVRGLFILYGSSCSLGVGELRYTWPWRFGSWRRQKRRSAPGDISHIPSGSPAAAHWPDR